jgi:hypothetical protein
MQEDLYRSSKFLSFRLICIKPVKWDKVSLILYPHPFHVEAMDSGQGTRVVTTVDHSDIRGLDTA